ncbi:MAG: DNA alkylation repair protein [Oscillospiraceae bacterium]|nr:DNA alkylation repair protein [Oscillospiraceae bacterium]
MQMLFPLQDLQYRDFQRKLIPGLNPDRIIGIRTPDLRRMAKELTLEDLGPLPHRYFEENQLHAFILAREKDFDAVIRETDRFLPYVDNWATCDQLSPKCFCRHRAELLPHICRWLASGHSYTVRFGIKMLMDHFLEKDFLPEYPQWVAGVRSGDYYVRMMQAWYFATALAKQYDAVFPFISEHRLDEWVHNKTIQKAMESYRIPLENKEILKRYRIK